MGKLLQINPVIRDSTSTGRIMKEIGELASTNGWESHIAYSRARDGVKEVKGSSVVPVGNKVDLLLHFLATRLFDAHGLASRLATKRFVRRVRKIDPDVVHIHNIHGYFLNYKILFNYLKESGKPVIWTVHDCWLFTGHCYYYSSVGCMRWKEGCHHCPQKKAFPRSLLFDRSKRNYSDKKDAFNSLGDKLTIVTVSEWLRDEMRSSFLSGCRFKVIHNGIDLDIFTNDGPSTSLRDRVTCDTDKKKIILGVASIWMKEKGLDDFKKLAERLDNDEVIVLVGKMSEQQRESLPGTIITLERTSDVHELASLYRSAIAFVNPTWQDNYPTVNMEATACGTPVITYRTGGSPESVVDGQTGFVVEQGDIEGILSAIRKIESTDREEWRERCRTLALKEFGKKDRYSDYITLYESLTAR